MRILFNHGLTAEELYTNTPKRVIDRKWKWFLDRYSWSESYSDAISDPFKYAFAVIIHRMLDDKVRFKLPVQAVSYFDFEIVTGEKFEFQRQCGRFQEIDFIESDFTGYSLQHYFKWKNSYIKNYQIYLGGELREKFLNKINSGEKFYTTKDITINDIVPQVHEKFNELTKEEIKKLLVHGFRRMHSCELYGCAITIGARKFANCFAYIGKLSLNKDYQIKEYKIRRDKKLRKIENWKKTPFDGYYYVPLTESKFKEFMELNKKSVSVIRFENVMPRRLFKECVYRYTCAHIVRIKIPKFKGYMFWGKKFVTRDFQYLGSVLKLDYTENKKTWLELKRWYETK